MKSFVIDASVIVKWIFPGSKEEHIPEALHVLRGVRESVINVLQPPHWLAEVIAVVVRLQPKIAEEIVILLNAMEFSIVNTLEVYQTACHLSERFNCHLFDALYHAVALNSGNASFITADEQYYKKAFKQGSIIRLADFSIFDD